MEAVPALLASCPDLTALPCLALLAGLLALDDTALAQTWLGQPLPAAVLTGLWCGDPVLGLAVGVPMQLVMLGNLPVGQTFTGDPAPAVVAVVGAACRAELGLVPALASPDLRFQNLEFQAMLGWLLVAAGLLSFLGHWIVQAERSAHGAWMQAGSLSLRDGSLRRMESLHLRAVGATFLRGAVVGAAFVLVISHLWLPLFAHLGGDVRFALALMPLLLPGLGIGTMLERYDLRQSWAWVLAGLVGAALIQRGGGG